MDLLHGLLEHAERGGGPEIAVAGESCSPAELIDRADRLADRLMPGVPVAVRASGSLDTVVAVVAALRAKAPLVPIADDSGASERTHILADSGARAILGEHGWSDVDLPVVTEHSGAVEPDDGVAPLDVSLVVYTSGTTGPPKGVLL
ncbi:MAG: AMP-binding protein, partial [Ilumatobacteraceae bacterium]